MVRRWGSPLQLGLLFAVGIAVLVFMAPESSAHSGIPSTGFTSLGILQGEMYNTIASGCDPDPFNSEHTRPWIEPDSSYGYSLIMSRTNCWVDYTSLSFPSNSQILGMRVVITAYPIEARAADIFVYVDGTLAATGSDSQAAGSDVWHWATMTPTATISGGTHTMRIQFTMTQGAPQHNLHIDCIRITSGTGCPETFPASPSCPSGTTSQAALQSFDADPFGAGWTAYRNPAGPNTAWWYNGQLFLTTETGAVASAVFAPGSLPTGTWQAHFNFRSSAVENPADGLVFLFYKNAAAYSIQPPAGGGHIGFARGSGTVVPGYGVEFDDYINVWDPNFRHVGIIQDSTSNHLATAASSAVGDTRWHTARIVYEAALSRMTVFVDGTSVLVLNSFTPVTTYTGFGFSAGTGSQGAYHIVDDFLLCVPVPPVAAFTTTVVNTCTQRQLQVNASSSTAANGPIISYNWAWGDATSGSGVTGQHQFGATGTYNVALTITDSLGLQDTETIAVTWPALAVCPPVATFTSSVVNTCLQRIVLVAGSTSTATYGPIASYVWSWGDGSTSTGMAAQHSYTSPGAYAIQLTVTDAMGTPDQETHIVTSPSPPASCVVQAPSPRPLDYPEDQQRAFPATNSPPIAVPDSRPLGACGGSVQLDGSASIDPDGLVTSWLWEFEDGTVVGGPVVPYQFSGPGLREVTLTVADDYGALNTRSIVLPIVACENAQPASEAVPTASGACPPDACSPPSQPPAQEFVKQADPVDEVPSEDSSLPLPSDDGTAEQASQKSAQERGSLEAATPGDATNPSSDAVTWWPYLALLLVPIVILAAFLLWRHNHRPDEALQTAPSEAAV